MKRGVLLGCLSLVCATTVPTTFQYVGDLTANLADHLILGRVDLRQTTDDLLHIKQAHDWLSRAVRNLPDVHPVQKKNIKLQLRFLDQELKELTARAEELKDLVTGKVAPLGPGKGGRQKRSLLLALGGLALIGASVGNLVYSGYLHKRIDDLEARQSSMLRYVDLTTKLVANNQQRIGALNKTLYHLLHQQMSFEKEVATNMQQLSAAQEILAILSTCEAAISHLSSALNRMQAVWTAALQGRIAVEMIPPTQVHQELRHIKEGLEHGYELAVDPDKLHEFYRLPCHLINRGDKFILAIPVPVYQVADEFQIYRHISVPVATGEGVEMILDTQERYLVVNRERTLHAEMTTAELQGCLQLHQLHLCPQQRVYYKEGQPTCLFLLFQGKAKEAQRVCERAFRVAGGVELVQLNQTHFLASTGRQVVMTRSCEGTGTQDVLVPKGITQIHLEEGCSLSADTAYIIPGQQQPVVAASYTVTTGSHITWDLTDMLREDYPHLDVQTEELRRIIGHLVVPGAKVRLQDVLAARAMVPTAVRHTSWAAMAFTAAGLLIVALFFAWVCCRYRKGGKKARHPQAESMQLRG